MKSLPRHLLFIGAIGLAGLLGACSTSGSADSADDTPTTTEAPGDETTTTTEGGDEQTTTTTDAGDDQTTTTDGRGGQSREEMIDEMAEAFLDDPSVPFDDREIAECVAGEFVDILGDDLMDMESGDLDEDTALELAETFRGCGFDLKSFFMDTLTTEGASKKQAECVLDHFGIENVERLVAIGMVGADMDVLDSEMETAVAACK